MHKLPATGAEQGRNPYIATPAAGPRPRDGGAQGRAHETPHTDLPP